MLKNPLNHKLLLKKYFRKWRFPTLLRLTIHSKTTHQISIRSYLHSWILQKDFNKTSSIPQKCFSFTSRCPDCSTSKTGFRSTHSKIPKTGVRNSKTWRKVYHVIQADTILKGRVLRRKNLETINFCWNWEYLIFTTTLIVIFFLEKSANFSLIMIVSKLE